MQTVVIDRALDLSYLKGMVGDNPEFMIEIFNIFLSETPQCFIELETAIDNKDWEGVSKAVHKMKPTFVYVGREDIKDFAHLIEQDSKNGENLETLPERVNNLKKYSETVYRQLEDVKLEFSTNL